jgi:hypothetical protein
MAARVENRCLPGIVTVVAQGDDVYVDVIGAMAFGGDRPMRRSHFFDEHQKSPVLVKSLYDAQSHSGTGSRLLCAYLDRARRDFGPVA